MVTPWLRSWPMTPNSRSVSVGVGVAVS